jgi:hypothetical protein
MKGSTDCAAARNQQLSCCTQEERKIICGGCAMFGLAAPKPWLPGSCGCSQLAHGLGWLQSGTLCASIWRGCLHTSWHAAHGQLLKQNRPGRLK